MGMIVKKLLLILTGIVAFLVIAASLFFSSLSTRWRGNNVYKAGWGFEKLKDGWIIDSGNTSPDLGKIAIKRIFTKEELFGGKELIFVTHNQNVRVVIDDGSSENEFYSFGFSGNIYSGSENGNAVHSIKIPEITKEKYALIVQLENSFNSKNQRFNRWYYQMFRQKIPEIYIGNSGSCVHNFVLHNLYQTVPVGILFFISAVLLVFHIANRKILKNKHFFYFFCFTLECAFCFFCETNIVFLHAGNTFTLYLISSLFIAMWPLSFLFFLEDRKLLSRDDGISKVLNGFVLANVFVTCLASFFTFIPFSFVRIYLLSFAVILYSYGLVLVFSEAFTIKVALSRFDVFMSFAVLCFLVDMLLALFKRWNFDLFRFSRIAVMLFYTSQLFDSVRDFYNRELMRTRSELFKEISTRDFLTGCLNGYNMWNFKHKNSYIMILFNICNAEDIAEQKGQNECDNAIRDFAQILKVEFLHDSVYRLNASKFSVIGNNRPDEVCKRHIKNVEDALESYNSIRMSYKLRVVYNYGRFEAKTDVNIDGLYSRLFSGLHKKSLETL